MCDLPNATQWRIPAMLWNVTADSESAAEGQEPELHLVLCARDESLAAAWREIADPRPGLAVRQGPVLDLQVGAVVRPPNSYGRQRGASDSLSARAGACV